MPTISTEEYQYATDTYGGWCTECEEFTHDSAEPDARKYECPECGEKTCYGAEEARMMGLFDVD